jgi:hypothetical protein
VAVSLQQHGKLTGFRFVGICDGSLDVRSKVGCWLQEAGSRDVILCLFVINMQVLLLVAL